MATFELDLMIFDLRNVRALQVLRNRALQIDIYLLTYLLEW